MAPGNVMVTSHETGLPSNSVVNVSQLVTADKRFFDEYIGELSPDTMRKVAVGLRTVMGL